MKGDLADTPLVEVVRDIHFDSCRGVLAVQTDERASELYFDQGDVFHCKVDSPEARLDNQLVKWGLVPAADVEGLLRRAGQDLRGALVREGVFPDERAFDQFVAQVMHERMVSVFATEAGTFELTEKDVSELRGGPFPMTTPNVAIEGLRRTSSAAALLEPLLADESPLCVNPKPTVPLESLRLGPSEGYVLSQVSGTVSPHDIARTSPLGETETGLLLYGLLVFDVLRHPAFEGFRFAMGALARQAEKEGERDGQDRERIEAEYQRVRTVDIFQLLPGSEKLEVEERREAIKEYQKSWDPSGFSEKVQKEMREQLMLILGRGGEALLAMLGSSAKDAEAGEGMADGVKLTRLEFSKSETQAEMDAVQNMAAESFRHAKEAFRVKDIHSAIQYLREAIRKHEQPQYQEALGDALVLNPHWRQKAEEAYRRALELDEYNADLLVKLGALYARSGLKSRAKREFQRCLDMQADHQGAKDGMRELKRRR